MLLLLMMMGQLGQLMGQLLLLTGQLMGSVCMLACVVTCRLQAGCRFE